MPRYISESPNHPTLSREHIPTASFHLGPCGGNITVHIAGGRPLFVCEECGAHWDSDYRRLLVYGGEDGEVSLAEAED
jgi:hypothetical protein